MSEIPNIKQYEPDHNSDRVKDRYHKALGFVLSRISPTKERVIKQTQGLKSQSIIQTL